MSLFSILSHWFKRKPAEKKERLASQHQKRSPSLQILRLEPILTPSGLLDTGLPDPGWIELQPDHLPDIPDIHPLDHYQSIEVQTVSDPHHFEVQTLSDPHPLDIHTASESDLLEIHHVATEPSEISSHDPVEIHPHFEGGVFTVGETGEVGIDFLYDGGGYKGEVAVFSLEGLDPNAADFAHLAAERALSNSVFGHVVISDPTEDAKFSGIMSHETVNWNGENYLGVKTFSMEAGTKFGIMLVPNGTVQDVFDGHGIGNKLPLFSMSTANPNDAFHVGQIADVNGDGNTFVMEDMRVDTGSDRDYNDIIFQVRGATGHAVTMDELIDDGSMNSANDWRTSHMGEALISYAEPYVTPDLNTDVHEPLNQSISVDLPPVEQWTIFDPTEPDGYNFHDTDQPIIGVIDTGISGNNPYLDYHRIISGHDYLGGDADSTLQHGEIGEHGTHVLGVINSMNDDAPIWTSRAVGSGEWSDSLREFVDAAKTSGQPHAVVNLSFDLTQINFDGSETTRYEFTPQEWTALEYAHQNHVIVVAAAGNDGDAMSALGQASQQFDNIITVGAAETFDPNASVPNGTVRADYSSYGYGLDIMANGGTSDNPVVSTVGDGFGAMAGTSVASAQVTGAVSQVWAANPELSYRQVIDILKSTATDLTAPNWDGETGTGLLNLVAAVHLAGATTPQDQATPPIEIPTTWSGAGLVTPMERAAGVFDRLPSGTVSAIAPDELQRLNSIKNVIVDVARRYNILPEIVAGIISRETNTRNIVGDGGSGHGYMQLDIGTFPNIGSQPWDDPAWNIDRGVNLLINDKYAYLRSRLPESLCLRGSLAAYNCGQGNVVAAYNGGLNVDIYTTGRNYGTDVLSRARWLLQNGWSGSSTTPTPPSQQTRRPYIVSRGETLSGIAQSQLGNANRWREIQKEDGSTFTDAEASRLQIGQRIYLPVINQSGTGNPVINLPVNNPTQINNQIGRGSRSPRLFQEASVRLHLSGTPTGDAYRWGNGWTQEFRNPDGSKMLLMLEDGVNEAYGVWGSNLDEYLLMGGAVGRELDGRQVFLGYPRSNENVFTKDGKRAVWQAFAASNGKARIHNLYGYASVATWGGIGELYTNMNGAYSFLGMPTRREYIDGDTIFADFQGGRIAWHRNNDGRTEALRPGEQPSWRQTTQTGRVNSNVGNSPLNFRNQPNTGASIISTLDRGTTFKIIRSVSGGSYSPGNRTDWCEIEVNGTRGYVAAYYVDVVSNDSNNGGGGNSSNGDPLLTVQGSDYFRNRPQFYTTGNRFYKPYAPDSVGGTSGHTGNCTWYAFGRVKELGGREDALTEMSRYGDAGTWHNHLAYGASLVSDPKPGDIAEWDYGHVAVVEKVERNSNGSIRSVTLSQSSWGGALHKIWSTNPGLRSGYSKWPTWFIRVPGV